MNSSATTSAQSSSDQTSFSPKRITIDGVSSSYHEGGSGPTLVLVHGSGPGVRGMSAWRTVAPVLAQNFRVLVPDLLGFGDSDATKGHVYGRQVWTDQLARFCDELCGDEYAVVGTSMGGALALSLTCARPDKVTSVVVAGTMGLPMPVPQELDDLWGYQPDRELTRTTLETLAYDKSLITEELIDLRMEASSNPPTRESYEAMFPAPRDRWVEDLALSQEEISSITQPVLLIHGLEDPVIPFADTSLKLIELLPDGEMHVFGQCKHWPMVEYADKFNRLVIDHVTPD